MKYFTKYLPIDGEITEAGVAYKSKKCPHLEAKFSTAPWNKKVIDFYDIEKVKLFLCSRDIQVGDVIKLIASGVLYDSPITCKEDIEAAKELPCYKVIGQISPDALAYVKEGDEFDDADVEECWVHTSTNKIVTAAIDVMVDVNLSRLSHLFHRGVYRIKGRCGYFH